MSKTVLITGAAGNLGGFLGRHLLASDMRLRLMVHKTQLAYSIADYSNTDVINADLGAPETLDPTCVGVDCVVHLAGKLFTRNPKKDLPLANTDYTKNILTSAVRAGVKRFILISFPQVEGPTGPKFMATDRTDKIPIPVLARSQLEAEKALIEACQYSPMEPVILRSGLVYGKGLSMFVRARKLLEKRLLGLWTEETLIHLISLPDFLNATEAAIRNNGVRGIYNLGDEQPVTLQELVDRLARRWRTKFAWRAPKFVFLAAAACFEVFARLFRRPAYLNRDLVRFGMVPFVADTKRMRQELLPNLFYPTLNQGIDML